ncbi:hypothetical protein [Fictibacillus phosphorivorans]|uniref:hypothetical protein n=1 Tax=Fictibacillus phosphorivorans TaxID=1221500 RepID=UPI00203F4509|nr:hypothetical protein [Fictibacillus phosphorivorans]MCM3718116.1 hypothetical protein [Fictibacillus phosphorivorans]MCM3775743.1 hypothetical protein [Fictibacillus phosphorivorans]
MKKQNKVVEINKWARTINQKRSMLQLTEERKKKREDKIKQIEKEADDLLKELGD